MSPRRRRRLALLLLVGVFAAFTLTHALLTDLTGSPRAGKALAAFLFAAPYFGLLARWERGRSPQWAMAEGIVLGGLAAAIMWFVFAAG